MQGIPYIHNAKLIWAKLIWTLLLLGAIGGMTVHLKYLFDNYFEFEKATKIELGFDNLKFPSITLCNTNIIKRSSLESLENATALKKLIAALKPENLAPGNFEAGGNTNQNQGNGGGVIDPNPDEGGATGQETPPQPTSTLGTTKPFTGGQGGGTGVRTGPPPENATPPGDQNSPPPSKEPPRVNMIIKLLILLLSLMYNVATFSVIFPKQARVRKGNFIPPVAGQWCHLFLVF